MIEKTKIKSLRPYPDNPRISNLDLIKESLSEHGQYRPITVNKDNTILAGNHTWEAMKELGHEYIYINRVDVDDETARRIVLVDNRLNDLSNYDKDKMTKLLNYFMEIGQLEGTGFSPDDVDDILSMFGEVEVTEFEEFQGGYALSDEEIKELEKEKLENAERSKAKNEGLNDVPLIVKESVYDDIVYKLDALAKHFNTKRSNAVLEASRITKENLGAKSKWFNLFDK